ncbi:MAG: hypothetical protein PHQ23_07730, partial [Candidatus Wallbacteria bacterium]|nr:hypothetical protein [Candidatus Wallbacteria bacterium]
MKSGRDDLLVIIPAIKKNVAFSDDLIKKLEGVTLIQRALDKALTIVSGKRVTVFTDSEEIRLICDRHSVKTHFDRHMRLHPGQELAEMQAVISKTLAPCLPVLILWPYAPLVPAVEISRAIEYFFGS